MKTISDYATIQSLDAPMTGQAFVTNPGAVRPDFTLMERLGMVNLPDNVVVTQVLQPAGVLQAGQHGTIPYSVKHVRLAGPGQDPILVFQEMVNQYAAAAPKATHYLCLYWALFLDEQGGAHTRMDWIRR
jgi:hypothetical protein